MFVVSRRVVEIKEIRELSPDIDIGRRGKHTSYVVCIDSVFRESTPVLMCYIRFSVYIRIMCVLFLTIMYRYYVMCAGCE